MSLNTLISELLDELGLPSPTQSFPYTADISARQATALIKDEVQSLASQHTWPQLRREWTITLVDGQDSYGLPDDFDRALFRTHWDRTSKWELLGPLTPEEWQIYKSGTIANTFGRTRYRVMGNTSSQFFIDPVPTSAEAGTTLVFEYQSKNIIIPRTWTASTYWATSYCYYNGNIYESANGTQTTTGTTPPTHTTGTESDGAKDWTYKDSDFAYEYFLDSEDQFVVNQRIVKLGAKWKFLEQKGLEVGTIKNQYDAALQREMFHLQGARTVNLASSPTGHLLSYQNTPDTGYGT